MFYRIKFCRFLDGYGRINDISLKYGFAFVDFESSRDAEDAVHDLDGRTMSGDKYVIVVFNQEHVIS